MWCGYSNRFINLISMYCLHSGAWLTLAIWDHVTYKMDLRVIVSYLLPITKGIAHFFLDYLLPVEPRDPKDGSYIYDGILENDTIYFSGPTTSPETSFALNTGIYTLAFTPAIDASVLRQTANAYKLAVDLLKMHDPNHDHIDIHTLRYHEDQGKKYIIGKGNL